MKRNPGPGGIAPSTVIKVIREGKAVKISAGDLQADEFVWPGFGRNSWHVESVEMVRSSVPGWKLVYEGGIELECANGTVLAGFAGPTLPSDPNSGAALAFIRHPVNTREARRRFRIKLLNCAKETSPALNRLFGSRKRFGTRELRKEKVFYFYEQAAAFLAACRNADPAVRAFSAVDVASVVSIVRADRYKDWQIAGQRAERDLIFPLFHLDEDSPLPAGGAVLDEDLFWRGEWQPIVSCTRLHKPSEWVVPVFAERDGRAWRDGREHEDEPRSENPLIIAAGQVPVFMSDPFVNQRVYDATQDSGRKRAFVRVKPQPPELYDFDDVARRVPADSSQPVTESAAAEQLWALFARMAGSGVDANAILERLKKRYRKEVWQAGEEK